jgi:hypothetical protein
MYFLHRSACFVAEYEGFTGWHACCIERGVRKWIAIAPLVFAAACSKSNTPPAVAQNPPVQPPAVAQPAGNPEPVAPPTAAPEPEVAAPPAPVRAELVIPSGTALRVRLDSGIDTRRNHAGDGFTATLSHPVTLHGETAIPAGTRFRGHVTEAAASGRLKGRPVLALTLDSFRFEGREHPLRTSRVERVGPAHKKRNAILIGGGAGLGAAIGAIAGGGKGALIGGAAGAGAGTAGAAATGKEQLAIPAESALVFTMRAPVRM